MAACRRVHCCLLGVRLWRLQAAAAHHRHDAKRPRLGWLQQRRVIFHPALAARLTAPAPPQAVLPAAAQQLTGVWRLISTQRCASEVRKAVLCCYWDCWQVLLLLLLLCWLVQHNRCHNHCLSGAHQRCSFRWQHSCDWSWL